MCIKSGSAVFNAQGKLRHCLLGMSPDMTFFWQLILDRHINAASERFCVRTIQNSSDWDLISRERFFLVLF